MSDLLSAASLLMTVIAILYGLWHNELSAGLKIHPGHPEDNRPSERKVYALILAKALPLTVMAWATSFVFMPEVISLSVNTIRHWQGMDRRVYTYSAVNTAFCLVVAISMLLSCYTSIMLVGLSRLWLQLQKK
jgi:hypothetical protein